MGFIYKIAKKKFKFIPSHIIAMSALPTRLKLGNDIVDKCKTTNPDY